MPTPNRLFAAQRTTIFTVMSALAATEGAINLGQGYPDEDGPNILRERAARALREGPNQYPPMRGLPVLRAAVAEHDRRFYGIAADPETDILVTSGATEALADCFFGLLNPGDEAIVFEPVYDSYAPMIALAGAQAVPVRLEPPGFKLPRAALEAAITPRTKLLVLNAPMNPSGKVFDNDELAVIADLCIARDLFAVCDEVYEHLLFDGRDHRPLMTLPGMADRAVRIASAGKTFALTGWKVGYVTGPAPLIDVIAKAHQFNTFTTPPALQLAVAEGLRFPDGYFRDLSNALETKRDRLAAGLARLGFGIVPAAGTYFLVADYTGVGLQGAAEEVCQRLTREAKVAAIPLDPFYTDGIARPYVRFCFCKSEATLDDALARLGRYFGQS